MIRSAATLFAKKTAIVAVTGVVVLGGATLALAENGTGTGTEEEACEEGFTLDLNSEECVEDAAEEETLAAPNDEVTSGDDDDDDADDESSCEGDDCDDDQSVDPPSCEGDCEDGSQDSEDGLETLPVHEEDDAVEDPEVVEQPTTTPGEWKNHGEAVSHAANSPDGACAGKEGRDRGQCIAGVARSDAGKKHAQPEAPAPADEPAEQPAEETVEASGGAAKQPGPPAHAGGNGKGKGGK